jgi:16S rRNA (guanine966-N2)-methyltransferase
MQITAGKHHRRKLDMLEGKEIRPTSSRVRQAVFNILMHAEPAQGEEHLIVNQYVADICAGSGALGLEALSRGAKYSIFVDANTKSLDVVRTNAQRFHELENCFLLRADATQLPPARHACSVVFIDPPYGKDLTGVILGTVLKQGWLKAEGVAVVEIAAKDSAPTVEGLELEKDREYGNTRILIYRNISAQ